MTLSLYNTMSRSVEVFQPISSEKVGMYCCGPTVYHYAHIGNLRTFLFEDLLRRVLEHAGYRVEMVMNITDVGHLTGDGDDGEDKLEKSARETGQTVWDIAAFYTKAFYEDIDALNIKRADIVTKATDYIEDMISLIKRLEAGGHTYVAGGNVYFSIDTFPEYGKLARLDLSELQAGYRVSVDENKKNPHDFVLWFTNSKFGEQTMMWDSPWGRGYPGWHIECSAMSMRYLGEQFDIHCGGIDAVPVHHTNEIAQSEAATGKAPWVKYWVHGEFLIDEAGKMSKSKGETLILNTLLSKGYDALDYRYFCLGAHYRSQLKFTWQALDAAKSARKSITEKIAQLKAESEPASSFELAQQYTDEFDMHLYNDLNAPRALATLWGLLKDDAIPANQKLAALYYMDRVLGLAFFDISPQNSVEEIDDPKAFSLIDERLQAKKEKNYARADELRKELEAMGYLVKDTPEGTTLTKKM